MSVRFRKSVSIGKGSRVNLSRSGGSLTFGGKGMSVNVGKRGTYLNTGVPGTGVYARTKIGGGSSYSSYSSGSGRSWASEYVDEHVLEPFLDENGEIKIREYGTDDIIDDPDIIRAFKRTDDYKDEVEYLKDEQREIWEKVRAERAKENDDFVNIHALSPIVLSKAEIISMRDSDKPEHYVRRAFDEPGPDEAAIRRKLMIEAEDSIRGLFVKKKREEFVELKIGGRIQEALNARAEREAAFEAEEDARETEFNALANEAYKARQSQFERCLSDDKSVLASDIEQWATDLEIPADISLGFDYSNGWLYVDLDLPEIEDIPTMTTKTLSSGKVKEVKKTQTQVREDYARCVFGLSAFVSACLFNLNANIENIVISGYTQRRNRKGDIVDEYIYSVVIPRGKSVGIKVDDPERFVLDRVNRMLFSSTYNFKAIEPFAFMDLDSIEKTEIVKPEAVNPKSSETTKHNDQDEPTIPDVYTTTWKERMGDDYSNNPAEKIEVSDEGWAKYGQFHRWVKCEIPDREIYEGTGYSTDCVPGLKTWDVMEGTGEMIHETVDMYVSGWNFKRLKADFPVVQQIVKDLRSIDKKFVKTPIPDFSHVGDPADSNFGDILFDGDEGISGYAKINFKGLTPSGKVPKFPIVVSLLTREDIHYGANVKISYSEDGEVGRVDAHVYLKTKSVKIKAVKEDGILKPKEWESIVF